MNFHHTVKQYAFERCDLEEICKGEWEEDMFCKKDCLNDEQREKRLKVFKKWFPYYDKIHFEIIIIRPN